MKIPISWRIITNLILSISLYGAGIYLLFQEDLFLADKGTWETGTLFSGASLYFLAFTLFGLATFSIAVMRVWLRGDLPGPPPSSFPLSPFYVDYSYKGTIIIRYWYILAFTAICFILACVLAQKVP